MTRESALYASGAYEGICGETPELLVNMIFDYFEAQLKAKDKITQDIKEAYELKSIAYDLLLEAIKLKDEEIERVKEAMQEFVNRCEKGEAVRSKYTYYKFKELLKDNK